MRLSMIWQMFNFQFINTGLITFWSDICDIVIVFAFLLRQLA